jgi:hypothetical protein
MVMFLLPPVHLMSARSKPAPEEIAFIDSVFTVMLPLAGPPVIIRL